MVPMTDTNQSEAAAASSIPAPPVAPKRYGYRVRDHFGHRFDDPWDWLRDGDDPEVRAHLEAENAWADAVTAPTREAAARLVEEVKAATALTDVSVPIRDGDYWYFRRFAQGQSYATHHRAPVQRDEAGAPIPLVPQPGVPAEGEELLVDENEWARGQEFFRLADLSPSPDGRLIAWARDTSGDERYTWVIQEASGRVIDEVVTDAGYGFAWADDSRSFIYMGVDDAWRACDVWLHRVGTPRQADELLLVEPDEGFEMGFAPSGFPGHVVIHSSSSTAGRAWLWLPAHPTVRPLPLMPVRARTLVSADSAGDRLFIVHTGLTQEGSLAQAMLPEGGVPEALARLGVASSPAFSREALADRAPGTPLPEDEPAPLTPFGSWEPLRSPAPGERITDVEAHSSYVALSLRSDSLTQVDVWDRREPEPTWRRVGVDAPVRTIATVPTPWEDPLRVEFQSQTVPPTVAEVRLPKSAPASSPASREPAVSSIIEHPSGRMVASTNARLDVEAARIAPLLPTRVGVVLIDGHNPSLAREALTLGIERVEEGDPFALLEAEAPHPRILDGGSWKDWLTSLLGLVDIAVVSEDFCPPVMARPNGEQVADFLRGFGITRTVRTRGERSVQYWWDGARGEVPVRRVEDSSTLGAGDAFHGAFAWAIERAGDADPEAIIRFASAVAGVSVSSFGTRRWCASPELEELVRGW